MSWIHNQDCVFKKKKILQTCSGYAHIDLQFGQNNVGQIRLQKALKKRTKASCFIDVIYILHSET